MTTAPSFAPQHASAPKATGGVLALGIVSIIYASLFRLCCGFSTLFIAAGTMFVSSGGLQDLLNMPGMENMKDLSEMASPQVQTFNFIQAFVILILGIAMLAGGIGLLRLRSWARTTLLAVAACEIVWALVSFIINVFIIIPSMSQTMGGEMGEAPPMMTNVIFSALGFFISLIFPIALLICLNLKSARDQFAGAAGQNVGMV